MYYENLSQIVKKLKEEQTGLVKQYGGYEMLFSKKTYPITRITVVNRPSVFYDRELSRAFIKRFTQDRDKKRYIRISETISLLEQLDKVRFELEGLKQSQRIIFGIDFTPKKIKMKINYIEGIIYDLECQIADNGIVL